MDKHVTTVSEHFISAAVQVIFVFVFDVAVLYAPHADWSGWWQMLSLLSIVASRVSLLWMSGIVSSLARQSVSDSCGSVGAISTLLLSFSCLTLLVVLFSWWEWHLACRKLLQLIQPAEPGMSRGKPVRQQLIGVIITLTSPPQSHLRRACHFTA